MDPAMGSIYLGDTGVDRHHLIIRNTHLRPWRTEFGGCNHASLETHLEAVNEWVWRCTWQPWLCEFGDALGSRDHASLEMHLVAVMMWTWRPYLERIRRYAWRLWLSEIRDAVGGHDCARMEEYFEAVNLEQVDRDGGAPGAETLFIS